MLYDRKETDFTFAAVRGPRPLSYFPEFVFLPPFCFVVTALRSATLVVLVCVGSLANHVSMVEDFKQRAFEDCRVTLGDTKDSLVLAWYLMSRGVCVCLSAVSECQ